MYLVLYTGIFGFAIRTTAHAHQSFSVSAHDTVRVLDAITVSTEFSSFGTCRVVVLGSDCLGAFPPGDPGSSPWMGFSSTLGALTLDFSHQRMLRT